MPAVRPKPATRHEMGLERLRRLDDFLKKTKKLALKLSTCPVRSLRTLVSLIRREVEEPLTMDTGMLGGRDLKF